MYIYIRIYIYRVIWYGVDKGDMYVDESTKISPKNRHGYREVGRTSSFLNPLPHLSPGLCAISIHLMAHRE